MQQEERVFYLSPDEAAAVAKAETGIGDLPRQMSFGLVLTVIAVILIRMIMDLPLPSFRMIGAYAVAFTAWIGLIIYSKFRVNQTAQELKDKPFYLRVSEEGLSAGKYRDDLSYRAAWNEIQMVESGSLIYRITSPMGRLCLPKTALSAEERGKLESLETVRIEKKWM